MISFPHAISILSEKSLITPEVREVLADAPLYVNHHGDSEILMPSRDAWLNFITRDDFQKVLPSPITKTIQTSKGLRGFRIYSILMSDGDRLVAYKILASDTTLGLIIQTHEIADTLKKVTEAGQPLQVSNKCFSVHPSFRELPDTDAAMLQLAKIFSVSTLHFIHSVNLSDGYKKS
ncbi:MAG: hypothetical protein WC205_18415 [Opitutaceae bacterium]|jgi:hypothetical protein